MNWFWDTSALLSLIIHDCHYEKADRMLSEDAVAHVTSPLVLLETENRLRSMEFEKERSSLACRQSLQWLEHIAAAGLIRQSNVKDIRVLTAESRRMLRHFSPGVPHGTMDVIHVASARLLKADGFFTFDANQSTLAKAAGFQILRA